MGMFDPQVGGTKFQDLFEEDEPFILKRAKIVHTGNMQYGDDRMIVLTVIKDGEDVDASIWGKYLLAQVESMERNDLPKEVKITRQHVEGFGRNAVKMIAPTEDSDIPF